MVLLIAVAIALLAGVLCGGSLSNASATRIRYLPFLMAALLVQVALVTPILGTRQLTDDLGQYIYSVTLIMTLAVRLENVHIPGRPGMLLGVEDRPVGNDTDDDRGS